MVPLHHVYDVAWPMCDDIASGATRQVIVKQSRAPTCEHPLQASARRHRGRSHTRADYKNHGLYPRSRTFLLAASAERRCAADTLGDVMVGIAGSHLVRKRA